jgi:hypothetical protein
VQPTGETVTLALNGYQSQTVSVRAEGGGGFDSPRLAPNPVYVELAPAPATPSAKKLGHRKKKTTPVAHAKPAHPTATAEATAAPAAPSTTASVPAASPAPAATAAPAPPPPAETAASATNYPWPSR